MPNLYKSYIIPFIEIGAKILSIFTIFIIIRLLTQEDFGQFNYINSIVLVFSIFLDLGTNSKAYTLSLQNKLTDLSRLFYTRIILSATILILFNLIILLLTNLSFATIGVYSIVIWLTSLIAFLKLISRGRGFYRLDALAITIEPFFKTLFLIIVFYQINNISIDKLYLLLLSVSSLSIIIILLKVKNYFSFSFSSNFLNGMKSKKLFSPLNILFCIMCF